VVGLLVLGAIVAVPYTPVAAQIVGVMVTPHTFADVTENAGFERAAGWRFDAHGGQYEIVVEQPGTGERALFLQGVGSDLQNVTLLYTGTGAQRPQLNTPDLVVRFLLRFDPAQSLGLDPALVIVSRVEWEGRLGFRLGVVVGDVPRDAEVLSPAGVTLVRRGLNSGMWQAYVLGLESAKPAFVQYLKGFGGAPEATEADQYALVGLSAAPSNATLWLDEFAIGRVEAARAVVDVQSRSLLPMNAFVTEMRANETGLEAAVGASYVPPLGTFPVHGALPGVLVGGQTLELTIRFSTGLVLTTRYVVRAELAPRWL
jgi:hypothetical protein